VRREFARLAPDLSHRIPGFGYTLGSHVRLASLNEVYRPTTPEPDSRRQGPDRPPYLSPFGLLMTLKKRTGGE
jgi:hypothetical protein